MNVSDYIKANNNVDSCGTYSLNQSNYRTCNTTNWRFASLASTYPWTIAPFSNSGAYGMILVFSVGTLDYSDASTSHGVAPVLYLSSDISLEGEGTSNSPYTVG